MKLEKKLDSILIDGRYQMYEEEMDTAREEIDVTKKEPQIAQELKILENRISALSENINNLFTQLKPVLKEKPKDCANEEEAENLCDVANEIRRNRREIERIIDFVKDIQNDLEV